MTFAQRWVRQAVVVVSLLGVAALALAQNTDVEYLRALTTVYAGGVTAGFVKDWCDDRAPDLQNQTAKVFNAWRVRMGMADIEARVAALLGERKASVDASLEDKREELYAKLDQSTQDPAADCADLETFLNTELNLRTEYAKEYEVIASRPVVGGGKSGATAGSSTGGNTGSSAGGNTGSSMGSTGSGGTNPNTGNKPSTPTTTPSKLPALPAFDYAQYAKLKLDPEKEPIPDEYRCYPEIRSDKYATPAFAIQILPGRKYRAGIGSSVYEGAFRMDRYDLFFTSGALMNATDNSKHYYTFNRREGAELWVYNLGSQDKSIDFRCYQRGGSEQIQQLKFKRKDPQPGSFPCVTTDGSNQNAGTLEVLPNRRYRYQGGEGTYFANILGDHGDDYSKVDFSDGKLDEQDAFFEEDEYGQQKFNFGSSPKIECRRQSTPRPNPKFGPAKAPPAPGTGGLEGRYFYGRQQYVDVYNNLLCQGICYDYRFFQKNGYVYTDDAEDTEGLMDIDCTKTYPSGIPVCETYTLKGNMLQIGLEKPEAVERTKTGLKMDGDDYSVLEPLDGLKFNLPYYSQRITGAVVGTGGSSSSVNLSLRKDGRFSREANSSFFFGATDTGTQFGNVTAGAGGSSSRSNGGSYRVYGNTIEFKYDDGRVVRQFMFLPSGRKDLTFLHIGGSIYWEDKDKK